MRKLYAVEDPALEREVFGIHFRNPIGMAAGFDRNGEVFNELDALGFGFVEIGTITPQPQPGNPKPRVFRLPDDKAIMNRLGLNSHGLERAISNIRNRNGRLVIGCNIGKNSATAPETEPQDYLRVFRNLYQYVDYFVINISCNTSSKRFVPRSRDEIEQLIEPLFEFRRGQLDYRPILLKISPDLTREELDTIVDILIETPLDGIEAVAGSIDMARKSPGAVTGALLTKRAIEVVRYIAEKSGHNYPIIGSGGMMEPEDISNMLKAGASLVALNTGLRENGLRLLKKAAKKIAKNND